MSERRPGWRYGCVIAAVIAGAAVGLGCGSSPAADGASPTGGTGAGGSDDGGGPGAPGGDQDAASPSSGSDAGAAADAGGTNDAGAIDGGAGGTSVTLRFVSGSDYLLYASIGGGPAHEVQLDTGSLGLYVPKAVLGPSAQLSSTDTCSITYVSSGITLNGHKATTPVALLGSSKAGDVTPPPTTVPMVVCAIDDTTFNGGMMGVGFGRGTNSDPTRDVLLEMAAIQAGTMHPGYILSTHPSPQVQIGLTAATSVGFQTIALSPEPSGDWVASSLHGCLSVPKSGYNECGPMLVDTGVGDTLLWGPSDPTLGGVVPSGQTTVPNGVALSITSPANGSILDYAFTVGTPPDSPKAVSIRSASAFSINTGRALLVDYDYLFDAKAGLVGFRKAP